MFTVKHVDERPGENGGRRETVRPPASPPRVTPAAQFLGAQCFSVGQTEIHVNERATRPRPPYPEGTPPVKNTSLIQYIGTAVVTLIAVFATAGINNFWMRLVAGLVIACLGAFAVMFIQRRADRRAPEERAE